MNVELKSSVFAYIESQEAQLPESLRFQIASASQSQCSKLLSSLKGVLKSKSRPLSQKLKLVEVLRAGFDSINFAFVYETSVVLLSRLRSIVQRLSKKPNESPDFLNLLVFTLQEWATIYGEVAGESTLFSQVYYHLISNGVVFPNYNPEIGFAFLKDTIDLKGALFKKDRKLARGYYKKLRGHKGTLEAEITERAGIGDDSVFKLIEINEKINHAINHYREFKNAPQVTPTPTGEHQTLAQKSFFVKNSQLIQEPEYKESFQPHLNNSMEMGDIPFENIEESAIDFNVNDEWRELKEDYIKLKDMMLGKNEQIEDLNYGLTEMQYENDKLRESHQALNEKVSSLKDKKRNAKQRNEEILKNYTNLQTENQDLALKIEKQNASIRGITEELTAKNNDINKLNQKINDLNTQKSQLQEAVNENNAVSNDLQQKAAEVLSLHSVIQELKAKHEQTTDEARRNKEETANISLILHETSKEKQKLANELSLAREEKEKLQGDRATAVTSLNETIESLNLQVQHLDTQVEQLKTSNTEQSEKTSKYKQKSKQRKLALKNLKSKKEVLEVKSLSPVSIDKTSYIDFDEFNYTMLTLRDQNIEVSNLPHWIDSLSSMSSIIYEDNTLQIGLKLSTHADFFVANIYIGNKSQTPLEGLSTKVLCEHKDVGLKLNKEVDSQPVLPGKKTDRMIAFKIFAAFNSFPVLRIAHSLDQLCVLLPITPPLVYKTGVFAYSHNEIAFCINELRLRFLPEIIKAINFYGKFQVTWDENTALLQCQEALIKLKIVNLECAVSINAIDDLHKEMLANLVYTVISSKIIP